MSMGGVDLLQRFEDIYASAGLNLTSHPAVQRRGQDTFGFHHPAHFTVQFLAPSRKACLVFWMELPLLVRDCELLVVMFHFEYFLGAHSWKQSSVLGMSAWVLRDSQRSLLNRSWRVLTASPDVQRVLNHRLCDKWHTHGRLYDHFNTSSSQFPKSLCQALAKQLVLRERPLAFCFGYPGTFAP